MFKPEAILQAVGKYYGIRAEEIKGRGRRYTEARLMRRSGLLGLREIVERVGLHFSAVRNAVQRVANPHDGAGAQGVGAKELRIKSPDPSSCFYFRSVP